MAVPADQLTVNDILVTDVVVASPDDTLEEALDLLVENHVSALPVVVGNGRCVGVLSGTDLLDLTHELGEDVGSQLLTGSRGRSSFVEQLVEEGLGRRKVQEVMTADVISITPKASLAEAARKMVDNHVHRLMVVNESGQLLGIVSTMDLLDAFAETD